MFTPLVAAMRSCLILILLKASYVQGFTIPRALQVVAPVPQQTFLFAPFSSARPSSTSLMASSDDKNNNTSRLPFWLDPNTKGGVIVLGVVLFLIPMGLYNVVINTQNVDPLEAGRWIGVGFTVILSLAWASTYLFRVVTKDMTYARQLKDYENAVIAKRLEELDEDELQALVEEVERDDF